METRMIKRFGIFLTVVLMGFVFNQISAPVSGAADGKALFVQNKCNACHAVKSAGIEQKKEAGEEDSKAPDLSAVKTAHDAGLLAKFLEKTEKIEGKKHPKKWKGSDEELKAVTEWIASLEAKK